MVFSLHTGIHPITDSFIQRLLGTKSYPLPRVSHHCDKILEINRHQARKVCFILRFQRSIAPWLCFYLGLWQVRTSWWGVHGGPKQLTLWQPGSRAEDPCPNTPFKDTPLLTYFCLSPTPRISSKASTQEIFGEHFKSKPQYVCTGVGSKSSGQGYLLV